MSGERDPDIKQPPGTPAKEPNAPVEEPEDAPGPKAPVQEPEPSGPTRLANQKVPEGIFSILDRYN